jgi:alpha-D-ribose 1-methylphosphonate 5-triphosphate synthase subunit PhnH
MVTHIDLNQMTPGFSDPVFNSQETFRAILEAMAHPGQITTAASALDPPHPLDLASAAVCLTLLDFETPLWTDLESNSMTIGWLRFHCGCPVLKNPSEATFAMITNHDAMPSLDHFKTGDEKCPESSMTLIIQTTGLSSTDGKRLTGPGIETCSTLKIEGLSDHFWQDRQIQLTMFPLGVDIIFTCKNRLVGLPRTTMVEG